MKLSTKGRYGARAMLDLALNYNESTGPVALGGIAQRQGISEEYLEQIFSALRKAGIVESVRGAQGGYKPARPVDKISVGDILRALEGSLSPVDCADTNKVPDCGRYENCVLNGVWKKLRDAINSTVDSVSLADLVAQSRSGQQEFMYYI